MVCNPGDGFWLQCNVNYSNTFVGDVVTQSSNPIAAGFSLKGSAFPSAGLLVTALQAPLAPGDTVYKFNGSSYDPYAWDPDAGWQPSEPSVKVAEGFWILNNGTAKTWTQSFTP